MRTKQELLDIVKCCEDRFNRGPANAWKHSDYTDLSREIFVETEISISPNTLKRIFGKISVEDDYLPQHATLEALKKYGSYVANGTYALIAPSEQIKYHPRQTFLNRYSLVIIISFATIALALSLLFHYYQKENFSGTIKLKETVGLIPATSYFDLDLPNNHDSLFINFGDKSALVFLQPRQKTIAHVYLFPGVFSVTLQSGLSQIASTRVSIHSNKWVGLGFRRQRDLPEHYYAFPADKNGRDSLFHIENSELFRVGLDTTGSFFTRLSNFTPLNNLTDNFVFEGIFRNQLPEKGLYCKSMQFQISGMDNNIRFKFVNSGCSNWILNYVSEKIYEGSKMNLSQFVIDLNRWNSVRLTNQNKKVSLVLNNIEIFNGEYKNSLGQIQGLFLEFEGNGYVRSCVFKSLDGKICYQW